MLVSDILRNTAVKNKDKTAIYFEDQNIPYKQLDQEVDNLAQGLIDLGLKQGQRVAVLLGNNPDFIRSYFGITRAGGTIVPLNPLYKGEEIKYILNDAEAVLLITTKVFSKLIESIWDEVPSLKKVILLDVEASENLVSFNELINKRADAVELDIKDDEVAACLYTSGTTGKPKGALLTHKNLVFDCQASVERIQFTSKDKHLCVLPLFHTFAQMASLLCPILSEGDITVVSQFRPDIILKEIMQKRISVFCGVPAMFNGILSTLQNNKEYDISSLRLCISGGAPMPVEILNVFDEQLNICILEGNGPTETSPVSYLNPPSKRKVASVGLPLDGVKVKIVDDYDNEVPQGEIGEICVHGDNVMKGYLNQPEATNEALKGGWLHTGDLGKVDEDGYVFIVDRKKDMLIVGGLNVYPREVEECIYTNAKVAEAAVIGVSDGQRGEIPMAFVALKAAQTATVAEIVLHCRERLANYKCPRQVAFLGVLPKNATGKIDKKQLKEAYNIGMISASL